MLLSTAIPLPCALFFSQYRQPTTASASMMAASSRPSTTSATKPLEDFTTEEERCCQVCGDHDHKEFVLLLLGMTHTFPWHLCVGVTASSGTVLDIIQCHSPLHWPHPRGDLKDNLCGKVRCWARCAGRAPSVLGGHPLTWNSLELSKGTVLPCQPWLLCPATLHAVRCPVTLCSFTCSSPPAAA